MNGSLQIKIHSERRTDFDPPFPRLSFHREASSLERNRRVVVRLLGHALFLIVSRSTPS